MFILIVIVADGMEDKVIISNLQQELDNLLPKVNVTHSSSHGEINGRGKMRVAVLISGSGQYHAKYLYFKTAGLPGVSFSIEGRFLISSRVDLTRFQCISNRMLSDPWQCTQVKRFGQLVICCS